MSRSIGDHAYKDSIDVPTQEGMIVSCPDVHSPHSSRDRFIVLTCDRIFEVMSRQLVVNFINLNLDQYSDKRKIDAAGVNAISKDLCGPVCCQVLW